MDNYKAILVGGMLYGDQGKGTTVEHYVHKESANLVVRFNGGPQAMHHIVAPDDKSKFHCCAQFGAGTLVRKQCKTLLSRFTLISPHTLYVEADCLLQKGISNPLSRVLIDKQCLIITPVHKLVNQVKETLRGKGNKQGSTGMGVGVAIDDAFSAFPDSYPGGNICIKKQKLEPNPTCIFVKDILADNFEEKLTAHYAEKSELAFKIIQEHKDLGPEKIDAANQLYLNFIEMHSFSKLLAFYQDFANLMKDNFVTSSEVIARALEKDKVVVFEGAQGALLD